MLKKALWGTVIIVLIVMVIQNPNESGNIAHSIGNAFSSAASALAQFGNKTAG